MGIQIIGDEGNIAEIGEKATGATGAQHVIQKPIPSSVGHYRTAVSLTMATSQAANSRLFEVRNTSATNVLILTRCYVEVVPSGTVTTAYVGEIGLWRVTGFSAVDTTNTVTPTSSIRRNGMTAYPGNANVRHVTVAGAAAGMTGGTLTKDGNMLGSCIGPVLTGPTAGNKFFRELVEDINGTHPLVVHQNEGWIIENVRVGSATSNVVTVLVDVSWAEVTAY